MIPAVMLAALAIVTAAPAASAATPTCGGKVATIVSGKRVIYGTRKADVIVATGNLISTASETSKVTGPANNIIYGRGGNDVICGGLGDDILVGGPGRDILIGGSGTDDCRPGAGGGTARGCEYADYSIVLTCPDEATVNVGFDCSLDVTNHGPGAYKYYLGMYREGTRNDFYCSGQPGQDGPFKPVKVHTTRRHVATITCWGDTPGGDTLQFWAQVMPNMPWGFDLTCDNACFGVTPNGNPSNNASGPETVVVS